MCVCVRLSYKNNYVITSVHEWASWHVWRYYSVWIENFALKQLCVNIVWWWENEREGEYRSSTKILLVKYEILSSSKTLWKLETNIANMQTLSANRSKYLFWYHSSFYVHPNTHTRTDDDDEPYVIQLWWVTGCAHSFRRLMYII